MDLAGRAFESIDWAWLERCRLEGVEESWRLDFKRENPLRGREQKRDLAADICGFANASGGLLLLGVDELRNAGKKQRAMGELVGVNLSDGFAAYKSTIEDIVRNAFDPRFGAVLVREITDRQRSVVAVGVERSVRAPHMVIAYDCGKFFLRSMTSVEMMNADQVREAVRRSFQEVTEAENRLDQARAAALDPSQSYRPAEEAIVVWAALTPTFRGALSVPLRDPRVESALSRHRDSHRELQGTRLGYDHRGVFLHPYGSHAAVDRICHDGTLERKDYIGSEPVQVEGKSPGKTSDGLGIQRLALAQALKDAIGVFGGLRSDLEIGGPALLVMGLLTMKGSLLSVGDYALGQVFPRPQGIWSRREALRQFGVEHLLTPPIETSDEFLGEALKTAADFFWQAGGHRECLAFDEGGTETECLTSWRN
jgi:hypothetical protein